MRLDTAGVLRCPEVFGRSEQQARLITALDGLRDGRGTGIVLHGEAGVGKSRLVEWMVETARAQGMRGTVGRASDAGKPTALAPIQEALVGCSELMAHDAAAELGSIGPLLAHILPVAGVHRSDEATPTLLGHAVLSAVGRLCPGTLLIIEDLHASDADTISVVRHLLGHAAEAPVMIVATTRPEGPGPDLISAARASNADVVGLSRFSPDDVCASVRAMLETDELPDGLIAHLDLADRLPLLVEDLLADVLARGDLRSGPGGWQFVRGEGAVSARFEDVVGRRLAELDTDARAVVNAAAVLGPVLALDVLPQASGRPHDVVSEAVRRAAAAQVLSSDGTRFRHSLTRDVALSVVPLFERTAIARRVAPSLSDPPSSLVAACAEVLVIAGQPDDAARLFVRSARGERRSGASDTAAERLERACEVVQDSELAAEVLCLSVETLLEIGRLNEARSLAAARESALPADARVDIWLALAAGAAATADAQRFDSHLLAATSLMGVDDRRRPRAMVLEALRMLQFDDADDRLDRAEQLATAAAADAARVEDAEAAADAWMVVGRCARFRNLDEAADAYERALQIATANDLGPCQLQAMHELGAMDMLRTADCTRLDLARDVAQRAGALTTLTSILLNISGCQLMRGDFEAAKAVAIEAETLAAQLDFPLAEVMATIWQACALWSISADFDRANAMLDAALDRLPDDPGVEWAVEMINRHPMAALQEDHAEATRIATTHRVQSEHMHYGPAWLLLVGAKDGSLGPDEVLAELGDTPRKARPILIRSMEEAALAIALGKVDPAAAAEVVSTLLEDLPAGAMHRVIALRHLGEAALVDGWGDGAAWIESAREVALAYGHTAVVEACDVLLRGTDSVSDDGRPDEIRAADVTPREWEVLLQLHDMPTNAELADRLHVSVRTIEKHVSSLLSKLQVDSRRELARLAKVKRWTAE